MCGLKVKFSQSPERRGIFQYALKVEVMSATGMPSKIFVFHQSPAGVDGNTFSEFDHIATPVDFQESSTTHAGADTSDARTQS